MSLIQQTPWELVRQILLFSGLEGLMGFVAVGKYFRKRIRKDRELMWHFCILIFIRVYGDEQVNILKFWPMVFCIFVFFYFFCIVCLYVFVLFGLYLILYWYLIVI